MYGHYEYGLQHTVGVSSLQPNLFGSSSQPNPFGSSSQLNVGGFSSLVRCFSLDDDDFSEMYYPQFSDSFREEQSPVEEVEEIQVPALKKKPNQRRQTAPTKKPQSEKGEDQRCYPWTPEEEAALCKCRVRTSEDSVVGNVRNERGFWVEVLKHMQATCPVTKRRTYDMVNEKCSTNAFDVESLAKMIANEYVMASDPYNVQKS
ncbi:hypothetical protein Tco_0527605 [Tanacetum coccineum]